MIGHDILPHAAELGGDGGGRKGVPNPVTETLNPMLFTR